MSLSSRFFAERREQQPAVSAIFFGDQNKPGGNQFVEIVVSIESTDRPIFARAIGSLSSVCPRKRGHGPRLVSQYYSQSAMAVPQRTRLETVSRRFYPLTMEFHAVHVLTKWD